MTGSSTRHFLFSHPIGALAALFLLLYPTVTLTVHGGASALLITATLISLVAVTIPRALPRMKSTDDGACILIATSLALASPLAATVLSEVWHGKLVWSLLDAPSRFVAAVPIMFALRRLPVQALKLSDLSFAIGAIASLVVLKISPNATADPDRLAGPFLDAIHYGDIALVLGALSALSLNWWRKDHTAVRVFKLMGLTAGVYASFLTGSRGGWLAIPVIAMIVVCVRGREKSRAWRMLVPLAILAVVLGVCMNSALVRDRILLVWSDYVQYSHGHKDTSTGVRLQLYEAAFMLMRHHLVFGLGPNGFANSMQALANAGIVTPLAAGLGRGETHNQMLAFAVNYGIVGALAGFAIYFLPCLLFARCLHAPAAPMRRAALLGLTFVASFFVFGLSVETFDLKMVASFYAAVIAILCGIAVAQAAPSPQRTASLTNDAQSNDAQSQCSAS